MGGLSQLGIRIANAGLFVLCSFLTATVVNEVAGDVLAPETAVNAPAIQVAAARRPTWDDREVILDRNLFGAKLYEEAPPVVEQTEKIEETKLPVVLLGTAAADDPELSSAAIEDTKKKEHQVVRVGDALTYHGQVTVTRIERRRIILNNAGRSEALSLDDEEEGGTPAPVRTARAVPRRERSSSRLSTRLQELRERVQRDRDERTTARSPANLFSEARILPKYEDGVMVGIQLSSIKEGSMYEQFGLSDGDVITELNGIPIDNPAASGKLLRELTEAKAFEFVVNGERRTIPADEVAEIVGRLSE